MKLWYSPASPFVRKVLVVAHEAGLADRIELVSANTSPVARNMDLVKDNPSGKIPAMRLDDGTVLFDSRVICAYLDSINEGRKLAPKAKAKRFGDMTLEALGDAIMDAAVLARYEAAMRPEEKRWEEWRQGQLAKVMSSLDLLDKEWSAKLRGNLTMGQIAVAAALGYLDFRFADINWRRGRRKLARWFSKVSERPSFKASEPKA
jgi:glutathione S-transferase